MGALRQCSSGPPRHVPPAGSVGPVPGALLWRVHVGPRLAQVHVTPGSGSWIISLLLSHLFHLCVSGSMRTTTTASVSVFSSLTASWQQRGGALWAERLSLTASSCRGWGGSPNTPRCTNTSRDTSTTWWTDRRTDKRMHQLNQSALVYRGGLNETQLPWKLILQISLILWHSNYHKEPLCYSQRTQWEPPARHTLNVCQVRQLRQVRRMRQVTIRPVLIT